MPIPAVARRLPHPPGPAVLLPYPVPAHPAALPWETSHGGGGCLAGSLPPSSPQANRDAQAGLEAPPLLSRAQLTSGSLSFAAVPLPGRPAAPCGERERQREAGGGSHGPPAPQAGLLGAARPGGQRLARPFARRAGGGSGCCGCCRGGVGGGRRRLCACNEAGGEAGGRSSAGGRLRARLPPTAVAKGEEGCLMDSPCKAPQAVSRLAGGRSSRQLAPIAAGAGGIGLAGPRRAQPVARKRSFLWSALAGTPCV